MRNDMKRVLITRPRRKRGDSYRNIRRSIHTKDLESLPLQESMAVNYRYDRKEPSDLFGPLRRYLRSQVGRPWDDVFHDICVTADERTTTGWHLRSQGTRRGHVFDSLAVDGLQGRGRPDRDDWRELYVDDDGILCRNPKYGDRASWDRPKPTFEEQVRTGCVSLGQPNWFTETILYRLNGVHWIWAVRRQNGTPVLMNGLQLVARDALTKRTSFQDPKGFSFWNGWHCVSFRYLSKAEKKELGLVS